MTKTDSTGRILKPATLTLSLEPRCVVGDVRDAVTHKLVTVAQGTTYGDTTIKAEAYAYVLGYYIVTQGWQAPESE